MLTMPSGISQHPSYFIKYLVLNGINNFAEMIQLGVLVFSAKPVCQEKLPVGLVNVPT